MYLMTSCLRDMILMFSCPCMRLDMRSIKDFIIGKKLCKLRRCKKSLKGREGKSILNMIVAREGEKGWS
jgi:hypothetical protein